MPVSQNGIIRITRKLRSCLSLIKNENSLNSVLEISNNLQNALVSADASNNFEFTLQACNELARVGMLEKEHTMVLREQIVLENLSLSDLFTLATIIDCSYDMIPSSDIFSYIKNICRSIHGIPMSVYDIHNEPVSTNVPKQVSYFIYSFWFYFEIESFVQEMSLCNCITTLKLLETNIMLKFQKKINLIGSVINRVSDISYSASSTEIIDILTTIGKHRFQSSLVERLVNQLLKHKIDYEFLEILPVMSKLDGFVTAEGLIIKNYFMEYLLKPLYNENYFEHLLFTILNKQIIYLSTSRSYVEKSDTNYVYLKMNYLKIIIFKVGRI
eukprot:GHVL01005536.1.p1 GENE.GHVL01005536.1~~GHVL01005536.1.p1  ORF type:complete len:328 (+),score=54.90 GHVL01005536.1:41-1024(+)